MTGKKAFAKLLVNAALATVGMLAASAAQAATYGISRDFGSSVFAYGRGVGGGNFIPYVSPSNCQPDLVCYPDGSPGNIVKNVGSSRYVNGTVSIPAGTVHFHPRSGSDNSDAIIRFVAPIAGSWRVSGDYWRNDVTPYGNGTTLSVYKRAGGIATLVNTYGISPTSFGVTFSFAPFQTTLGVGDAIEFALDNRGDYFFDSTGIDAEFSTAAVPEPEAWVMLITGFAGVGMVRRQRRAVAA